MEADDRRESTGGPEDGRDQARGHDAWQRRQAVQLMGQLPEDVDDALKVLEYARQFTLACYAPNRERGRVIALCDTRGAD